MADLRSHLALALTATLLASCVAPDEDLDAGAEPGLSLRVMPAATVVGGQLTCASSEAALVKQPIEGRPDGLGSRRTVRLQLFFDEASEVADLDRTLLQSDPSASVFEDIPMGSDYRLAVTVCDGTEQSALYTGAARDITVAGGGEETSVPVYLLPTSGFSCPGTATTPSWPDAPMAFAASARSQDGERALFAGGASNWFVTPVPDCSGCAMGSDAIALFDRESATFTTASARLPEARVFSEGFALQDPTSGRQRMLVMGGTSALVPFSERTGSIIQFGPEANATLPAPVWVELDGSAVAPFEVSDGSMGHIQSTFGYGLGTTRVAGAGVGQATEWVIAAGGVGLGAATPVAEAAVTTWRVGPGGIRGDQLQLDFGRVGPAVVSPIEGVAVIVGGQPDNIMSHLMEAIDLRSGVPTKLNLQIEWKDQIAPTRADLVKTSAFPHAIPISAGRFVVIGGFPVLEGRIAPIPNADVLYLVEIVLDEVGGAVARISVPDQYAANSASSQRVFATEVAVSDSEVWLVGGVGNFANFFTPSNTVVSIDKASGSIAQGPAAPYISLGAASEPLWGGGIVIAGGVTTSDGTPEGSPAVTNAAVLMNDRGALRTSCGPLYVPGADDDTDAGQE